VAGTQLIYTDAPGAVPASYTVPPGSTIKLSSVFARMDGTGAGGSWAPTLDLLSQSGNLMARVAVTKNLAAGDSARVTWAPFLRRSRVAEDAGIEILATYAAQFAAADFTSSAGNTWQSSGWPPNSTITKVSATSYWLIVLNSDSQSGATTPDSIGVGLYIDGAQEQAAFAQPSRGSTIITNCFTKIVGLGNTSGSPYSAGNHTLDVQYWSVANRAPKLLCSTSCDLAIVEFEVTI